VPVPKAEPLLVLDALHSTPVRRYLSAERVPMGLLPLGYPARGRWAQPERRLVEEVVHWNRWGSHRHRSWPSSAAMAALGAAPEAGLFAVIAAHNREIWTLTGQRPANGRAARNRRSEIAHVNNNMASVALRD
jgi:hypothetical protein